LVRGEWFKLIQRFTLGGGRETLNPLDHSLLTEDPFSCAFRQGWTMDGRKWVVLALGLLGSVPGCVASFSRTPGGEAPRAAAPVQTSSPPPVSEAAPRKPRPATLVALGRFREATATDPQIAPEQRQRLLGEACQAYQEALKLDPNFAPAYASLGHVYALSGDPERALEQYRKALAINAGDAGVWFEVGMFQSRQKQWEAACQSLTRAVQLNPENRRFASTLGFCLARAGRFNDSLALFTRLSGRADACFKVARMAHHLNQDDCCKELLRLALQEDPTMAAAREMLAQLEGRPAAGGTVQAGCDKPGTVVSPGSAG
jgi:hypothetical protein